MGITHTFTSTKSDGGDATLVKPSNWNADHTVTFIEVPEMSAPATPSSGNARIYAKSDGRIYSKGDDGVERGPFSQPVVWEDQSALATGGDEFTDASGTGWTFGGGLSSSDLTVVSTKVYDPTCVDIAFSTNGKYMYKTLSGLSLTDNFEIILTIHDTVGFGQMMGLFLVNDAGTGTGMSPYNDGNAYMWGLSSYAYNATGNSITSTMSTFNVLKLRKVGTTITGYYSRDGGGTYFSNTRTDSTTFTRLGIGAFHTAGGGSSKITVGRFNIKNV